MDQLLRPPSSLRSWPMARLASTLHGSGLGSDEIRDSVRSLEVDDRVLALSIFGSVARNESVATSDIDVLIVHDGAVPDDLADQVPDRVSIAFYRPLRLQALPLRSPLFAVHLAREGVVMRDTDELLSRVMKRVRPLNAGTVVRLAVSTRRRYDDLLGQPRGLYLDPHAASAELYALAKQAAMLRAARRGVYEFNRQRALDCAFVETALPTAARDQINALEESWLAARERAESWSPPPDLDAAATAVERLLITLER